MSDSLPALDAAKTSKFLDAEYDWRKRLPPQHDRLRRTLALLPEGVESVLDVGVGEGTWLALLAAERCGTRFGALDLSRQRLLDLPVLQADGTRPLRVLGDACAMPLRDGSFDTVTLLEVIEHIPDWRGVVREALRVARSRVIVTVPCREMLFDTVCVHCHRPTPLWGHIHSFDERSLDEFSDAASIVVGRLPRLLAPTDGSWLRNLYRRLRPATGWLSFRLEKKQGR